MGGGCVMGAGETEGVETGGRVGEEGGERVCVLSK